MVDSHQDAVRAVIASVLDCAPGAVDPAARIGTIPGWDSIAHMGIVLALEESIGRRFTADEIAPAGSLEDVAQIFRREHGAPVKS